MATKEIPVKALRWIVGERYQKPVTILKTMMPMRGLAILFVLVAHAAIITLAAETNLAAGAYLSPDILGFWQLPAFAKSVLHELTACAVPIFLFLAGYYSLTSPQTWSAIWSNSKKVLIPMVTWTLAGWAFSWAKGHGGWSVAEFADRLYTGRGQTGYFFILLIVQFYVLAKWLVPSMKRRPGLVLALSALVQLSTHAYDYAYLLSSMEIIRPVPWILKSGPFPEQLFPRFILSFALGVWAGTASQEFRKIIVDRFRIVVAAAVVAALLAVLERGAIFRYEYAVLGRTEFVATSASWPGWKASTALWTFSAIFLFFGCFQRRVPMKSFLDWLGKYSFQIFILHGMVMDACRSAMYKFLAGTSFYEAEGFLFLLAAGLLVPVLFTRLVQKRAPAALRLILLGQ